MDGGLVRVPKGRPLYRITTESRQFGSFTLAPLIGGVVPSAASAPSVGGVSSGLGVGSGVDEAGSKGGSA